MKKLLLSLFLIFSFVAALIYTGFMPDGFYSWVDSFAPPGVSGALQNIGGARSVMEEDVHPPHPPPPPRRPGPADIANDDTDDEPLDLDDPKLMPGDADCIIKCVLDGVRAMEKEIKIPLMLPDDSDDAVTEYFIGALEQAIDNIRREMPEIFWLYLGSFGIEWSGNRESREGTLTVHLNYSYTPGKVAVMREEINRVINDLVSAAPSDPLEAAAFFHDWIVEHTYYASHVAEIAESNGDLQNYGYAFNINGIFLRGSAVCEGFSKAYKLLCDLAGIPCINAFGVADGENHSWNYVQLDNVWYLVDATWNAPVSSPKVMLRDYFLKGSRSIINGRTISEIYKNDSSDYPPLSPVGYFERTIEN